MDTKSFDTRIKAVGESDGLKPGQFRALVSAFNNVDSYGDVVMPGAFTEDLERWKASGDLIPVIWSHDWSDPFSHLGYALEAEETEKGLEILGQIEEEGNPKAAQVHRLLKGRRVTQFSFAYDVEDAGFGKRGDEEVYELRKLKTYEVGPTLIGVNQDTELLAVKAKQIFLSGAKAGRVLSSKNYDQLKAAHESIGAVLAAATPEDDDAKASTQTPAPSGAGQTSEPSQVDEPLADETRKGKSDPAATSAARRARAVAIQMSLGGATT